MKTTFLRPVLDVDATGAKIKSLMKQRGITPRQLQIILNFPYVQTVYNWFSGKNMPTIDNLIV
ncbi:MAG: helix-turn-helix transcriptional regulator, partial [Treponema sp.]|nr:helix-turn-helix transcriptional regulator [Treponema sp.]